MADRQQVPTSPTSVAKILKSAAFKIGFEERRKGRPFNSFNDAWDYERGRCLPALRRSR
jgi:hypothetical protein